MKKYSSKHLLMAAARLCAIFFAAGQVQAAIPPTVRVMPSGIKTTTAHSAYAWVGKEITLWGNVAWGDSTSGTWQWDWDGDGTFDANGTVTNAKDIPVKHTYATANTYEPKLRVTDGNGEFSEVKLTIDVLPFDDGIASVNLAIERGLKWLYLGQAPDGQWVHAYGGYIASPTSMAVLSFENRGHVPTSPTSDIYRDTVVRGLNKVASLLRYSYDIGPQGTGGVNNPDTHGIYPDRNTADGRMNDLYSSGRSNYEHGMVMMAFAAAGSYKDGTDPYDTTQNPALNLTATIQNQSGGTITLRYYDILSGLVDYVSWAQTDSGQGRGAWRYSGNNSGGDNSVAQWNAIGAEAAEGWDLVVPPFVKSEMLNFWIPATYSPSTVSNLKIGGWGYTDKYYQTVSHAGAGLCMLSWLGVPKTDIKILNTLQWLDTYWAGGSVTSDGYSWAPWTYHMQDYPVVNGNDGFYTNYYAMYGIAKGARIARDATGNVSEITNIGVHDWYSEYTHHILHTQQSNGSWPLSMSNVHYPTLNTPWALLTLEQTVASLKPQAAIGATPNPVPPNVAITLDVSGSTHQDPAKFLVSWKVDFDADNGVNWVTPDAQGSFPAQPILKANGYPCAGNDCHKIASVQVTDNTGETDESSIVVHIETGNVPPIANPGGPYFGSVGASITLDGSGSYDPIATHNIIIYDWDLDGDGQYDDASGETIQHVWNTPYTGFVGLKVCDDQPGAQQLCSTASVYTSITVSDLKPVSYNLLSYRRINRNVWEYTYKFTLENKGNGDATNVSALLQESAPPQVTIVDGSVDFGAVGAGSKVTSVDSFTIRIDRTTPVQNSDLKWTLSFTDQSGTVWKLLNFPLY
jgi:hypothetical protein